MSFGERSTNIFTRVSMTLGFKLHLPNIHAKNCWVVQKILICAEYRAIISTEDGQQMYHTLIPSIPYHKGNPFEEKKWNRYSGHVSAQNTQIKEDNVTSCVFELVLFCFPFFFRHKIRKNCKHNKQHAHRYASSSNERRKKTRSEYVGNMVARVNRTKQENEWIKCNVCFICV